MSRSNAFDMILGIMLGAIVSRAITGNAQFFPALAAGGVLVAMHWIFSALAFRWHGFGAATKGHSQVLVRNGEVDWEAIRTSHMSDRDLWEDLRGKGVSRLDQVAEARLERSGELSVVKAKQGPKSPFENGLADRTGCGGSSGCGPERAVAGWPRSPARASAIRRT